MYIALNAAHAMLEVQGVVTQSREVPQLREGEVKYLRSRIRLVSPSGESVTVLEFRDRQGVEKLANSITEQFGALPGVQDFTVQLDHIVTLESRIATGEGG